MDRIKLLLLIAAVALSSCAKRYQCVCINIPGAAAGQAAGISKEVTGRTRAQAEDKCKRFGGGDATGISSGCVLK